MIHVVAVITAKPGMRASILQAFHANVPAVKAEQGCIEYGAAVDFEDGPKFQTKYGAGYLSGAGEMGEHGRIEGACGCTAHGGVWRRRRRT